MASITLESILITLAVLAITSHAGEVELEFHPPGDHRQGDTMKVVCRVEGGQQLDIVKVVKMVDGKSYEISTNDFMVETFDATGRYSMQWSYPDEHKEASFTISDIRGEDSGLIGCEHILLSGESFEAYEEFKVIVPPKSVSLRGYNGGVDEDVTTGNIILREGHDSGIECVVVVDGSHDSPATNITLDGVDAMQKFSKNENKTKNPNNGLVQMKTVITYEYLFAEPDLALNGQKLECTAEIKGFQALSSSADLSVHYKPRVECDPAGAEKGERAVLRCQGHMHPKLDLVSVTWKRKPETFELTWTTPDLDRHHLNVTDNGDGSYNFDVIIDEVTEDDFGTFKFEIQNAHDLLELKIKLAEVIKTTTATTTTTTKTTAPVAEVTIPTGTKPSNQPVTMEDKMVNDLPNPGAVGKASSTQAVYLMSLLLSLLPALFLS